MEALEVLKRVDFDWTRHIDSVWRDEEHHVDALHKAERQAIVAEVEGLILSDRTASPLGQVLIGPAGSGKTHLLGALRRELVTKGKRNSSTTKTGT